MKYFIFILLTIIAFQWITIKELKQKKPAFVVVAQEDEFLMNLPIVPKENIKGLE